MDRKLQKEGREWGTRIALRGMSSVAHFLQLVFTS